MICQHGIESFPALYGALWPAEDIHIRDKGKIRGEVWVHPMDRLCILCAGIVFSKVRVHPLHDLVMSRLHRLISQSPLARIFRKLHVLPADVFMDSGPLALNVLGLLAKATCRAGHGILAVIREISPWINSWIVPSVLPQSSIVIQP